MGRVESISKNVQRTCKCHLRSLYVAVLSSIIRTSCTLIFHSSGKDDGSSWPAYTGTCETVSVKYGGSAVAFAAAYGWTVADVPGCFSSSEALLPQGPANSTSSSNSAVAILLLAVLLAALGHLY
jgi:hypothetical protein